MDDDDPFGTDRARAVADLVGKRVRLLSMPDDPCPITIGTTGTVSFVGAGFRDGSTQIGVKWDDGRTLMMCVPPDQYEVLTEEKPT